ncbi:hypothetical protein [Aphanothece sacrum]|uniref:Signal recognition particle protein Srp54 n=1 Tax=Aphanothece sacrum FPU1 TaxID=1920663 RepID=A0A401IEE9_APHSA|nr:hypothetical protein [Aphanothece sacrum]GBF79648.1 signal recognition particle protein Srp54 [Aphanothece sacrum FPU1]GBF87108.1 signal recognition particle protein Srp54 [Aphanothece sacrum FPU3]
MNLNQLFLFNSQKRQQLKHNYQLLKQAVETVGKEFEQKSYLELLQPAEELFTVKMFEEHYLTFSGEAYHLKKDGTICFCLDVDGLPTLFGIKPSYHFYKRRDGSVYY